MDKIVDSLPEFFYDLIGIFVPGFYLYFCYAIIYDQKVISELFEGSVLNETVATIFITYLAGHCIYTLSSYFVAKTFDRLTGNPIKILLGHTKTKGQRFVDRAFFIGVVSEDDHFKKNVEKCIGQLTKDVTFTLSNEDGSAKLDKITVAYEICRNYVMENAKKRAGIIRKEQAYGEMARGIVFVSFFSSIWLTIKQTFGNSNGNFWPIFGFLLVSLVCFMFRYAQARRISPLFIYSTFCHLISENKQQSGTDEAKK